MRRFRYDGKVIVLSGASSGIGKSLASVLIKKHGAKVYALARGEARLQEVKKELGESYIPYPLDVSKKEDWQGFFDYLDKGSIKVDALINCAGVLPEFKSFDKTSIESLEAVLQVDFMSCAYAIKSLAPIISKGGVIINISSAAALCPFAGVSAYASAKSALDAFTQSIGCEYKYISASSVLPGFVRTDIMKNQSLNNKENKIIRAFSADPHKTARKILRRAGGRKRRIIVGKDAHLLSLLYRLFPRISPRIITWLLRKTRLELFSKI